MHDLFRRRRLPGRKDRLSPSSAEHVVHCFPRTPKRVKNCKALLKRGTEKKHTRADFAQGGGCELRQLPAAPSTTSTNADQGR
jgi:hypothetical protein